MKKKYELIVDELYWCVKCKRVFQLYRNYGGRFKRHGLIHHEDFPSIGKPRTTCPSCAGVDIRALLLKTNFSLDKHVLKVVY